MPEPHPSGAEPDDATLVRRFRRGDAAAYERLVRRHQDRLFRLACIWLRDDSEAADAVQEVFVRALDGLRTFGFRAAVASWLYATCRNVCRELNRRRPAESLDFEAVDSSDGPAAATERRDVQRRIRHLLASLTPGQRDVVLLRIFEQCSVRETASILRCREGTVKAQLHKALRALRDEVDE